MSKNGIKNPLSDNIGSVNRSGLILFCHRRFDAGLTFHMLTDKPIYNSVVTFRNITISTSASEPRNAKEIAVKKVSDVDVSMFGLEL